MNRRVKQPTKHVSESRPKLGTTRRLPMSRPVPSPAVPNQSKDIAVAVASMATVALPSAVEPFREETPSPQRPHALAEIPANSRSPSRRSQSRSQPSKIISAQGIVLGIDGTVEEDLPMQAYDAEFKENHEATTAQATRSDGAANMTRTMSEIIARRQAANHTMSEPLHPRRRKDRKLGRAPSGSGATSFTRPIGFEVADSVDTASPLTEDGSMTMPYLHQAPQPSQQLSYDAPGAEEHRRLMSKKMGMKFNDEGAGRRVESLGMVKDVEVMRAGVGDRVRGRHREAPGK